MADIDRSTVKALVRGDESAYSTVIDNLYRPVYQFAYRLCHDSATAEDITQETFLAVWKRAASFEGKSRFSTWVFGIAFREFLRARKKQAIQTVPLDEQMPCAHMPSADDRIRVREAVEALPDLYRPVVFLVYIQGLTYREAADVLDMPIGTLKSRMNYAFNILRNELSEEEVPTHGLP
jgi:RNA polymerase sigma factor (sigma-70 family)